MNLSLNSSQTIAVVAVAGALLAGAYAVGRSSGPQAPAAPNSSAAPGAEAAAPAPLVAEAASAEKRAQPAEASAKPEAVKPVVSTPSVKPAVAAPKPVVTEKPVEKRVDAVADKGLDKAVEKPVAKPALCADCMRVIGVRSEERQGEGSGLGVIGGAVIGGLLGSQVGGGSGKKLATIGGAVAGGYAGNEIEKRQKTQRVWIVKLEREDGRTLSHEQASDPGLVVGDVAVMREGELRRYP